MIQPAEIVCLQEDAALEDLLNRTNDNTLTAVRQVLLAISVKGKFVEKAEYVAIRGRQISQRAKSLGLYICFTQPSAQNK